MSEVLCVRCGLKREAIESLSLGGRLGREVREKVCKDCWGAWYDQSVKLINEYRLSLRDAKAREFIAAQMKIFLKLVPPPEGGLAPTNETPLPPA